MNVSGLPILPGINIRDIKTSEIQYSYLWLTLADTNRLHALLPGVHDKSICTNVPPEKQDNSYWKFKCYTSLVTGGLSF